MALFLLRLLSSLISLYLPNVVYLVYTEYAVPLPCLLLLHIRPAPSYHAFVGLKLIIRGAWWNARSLGMTLQCCGREVTKVRWFPIWRGKYSCLKAARVYLRNAHPSHQAPASIMVRDWFLFKAVLSKSHLVSLRWLALSRLLSSFQR